MNATVELKLFRPHLAPKEKPIDPFEVIDDFFDWYDLDEARDNLWLLLKHAMQGRNMPDEDSISKFVNLYENIHDLITANYIQYEQLQAAKEKAEKEKNLDK